MHRTFYKLISKHVFILVGILAFTSGAILFFTPHTAFALTRLTTVSRPIASNGDVGPVTVPCKIGEAYTEYLYNDSLSYMTGIFRLPTPRHYCATGVITYDGFNMNTILDGLNGVDNWVGSAQNPFEWGAVDTTGEGGCSSESSCSQVNVTGAWQGYNNNIYIPYVEGYSDGLYVTDTIYYIGGGPTWTTVPYDRTWTISADGDGSENATTSPLVIVNSDIASSTTWTRPTKYIITGDITVNSGVTLNIRPGTVIKFSTTTPSSLTINGTLNSIGDVTDSLVANQIYFSSLNDSASTTPMAGDWKGITVGSGGVANFAYTTIRYAGNASGNEAQIYNNGGLVSIASSTIAYGTTYGVKNSTGTTTITSSDLGFNDYGLYLAGGSASITASSTIHDNSVYGIYNNTTNVINAENNWWATSTGPYNAGSNSGGTGDNVSDYVDFTPWITDRHYTLGISSVDGNEIRWDGSTQYANEWYQSINTWNSLGSVNIATDTIFTLTDLEVSDVNANDVSFAGRWNSGPNPNTIELNQYFLQYYPSDRIQNVITHELGHALGLDHSFTGNIMYFQETPETTLGSQDINDYYYLWP